MRNNIKAKQQELMFFETRSYLGGILGIKDALEKESYVKTENGVTRIKVREEASKIYGDGPKIFFDKVGQAVFNIVDGKKKALASIFLTDDVLK